MRAISSLLTVAILISSLASSLQAQQQGVRWQQTLQAAKQEAAQSNRLVLVHFWAPSCMACLRMDQEVFSRPDVGAALDANYVAVKLNADHFPSTARQYGVTALPTDLVISPQGQAIETLVGFRPATDYINGLNWIASNAKAASPRVYAQIPGAAPQGSVGPGGPMANPAMQGPTAPAGSPPVANYAGPRESDYASRPGMAENAALASPASAGDRTAAPVGGGPSINPGMATAPNWPAYSNPVRPSPSASQALASVTSGGGMPGTMGSPSPNNAPVGPNWGGPGAAGPQTNNPPQATKPATQFPLALDGFCPVSLRDQGRWVPGDRRWGAFHQQRTYLFAGAEEQARFLKHPDIYAPVLSGNDVVVLVEEGQTVPGQRRFGAWYDDHVYLFASEAAYQKFYTDAPRYANAALQSARAPSTSSYHGGLPGDTLDKVMQSARAPSTSNYR